MLGCKGCHGEALHGELFAEEKGFGSIHASNLTRRIQHYTDAQIEAALRRGIRPDGIALWAMPSEMFTHLSAPDMAALIAHLRTLPAAGADTPPLRMEAGWKAEVAAGKYKSAPGYIAEEKGMSPVDLGPGHARGRMITMTACTECHAAKLEGRDGDTPNLDIVGAYSKEQFATLMRTGKPPSGKELRMMSDVARGRFAKLTDKEVADLFSYLEARAKRSQ